MAILKKHHKLEICRLRAHGKSYAVIEQHFKDKHDIILWRGQIQGYIHPKKASQKWLDEIERERDAFEKELRQEPLASQRVRLQRCEETYQRAMEWNLEGEAKLWIGNPDYDPENPESGPSHIEVKVAKYKSHPGVAVAAIRQAHEIVEGKKFQMEHSTKDGKPLVVKVEIPEPDPLPKIESDEDKL